MKPSRIPLEPKKAVFPAEAGIHTKRFQKWIPRLREEDSTREVLSDNSDSQISDRNVL